jgi:signal transduction histidine kinase
VVRTGQPELVAMVTDADLAALAETEAPLAHLRHAGLVSYMIVPLLSGGQAQGAIAFASAESGRRYTPEDLTLAEDVARRAALAVANARLHAQVRELTTLRERERIGRDLHDGVIQDIYAGTLQLEALAEDLPEEMQERLLGVADHFSGVIQDVRTYIKGLRARELEGRLLSEGLAALVREVGERSDLAATYAVEGTPYRVPDETANALLQITREALSNVIKHAAATTAHVRLAYAGEGVMLTIADDGRGFDSEEARGETHRGLRNLRMRAVEVGGVFSVQSALGAGTTLSVAVPAPRT